MFLDISGIVCMCESARVSSQSYWSTPAQIIHPSLIDFCWRYQWEVKQTEGSESLLFSLLKFKKCHKYKVNFWVKYSNQNIMFFMAAPFDQTETSSAKYLFSILTKKVKSVCGDGWWEVCGFQVLSTENFENSSNSAVERFHLQVCWWAVSGFLLLQLLWVGGLRGFPHACSGGFGLAAAILIKIKWLGICKSSHLLIVAANPS